MMKCQLVHCHKGGDHINSPPVSITLILSTLGELMKPCVFKLKIISFSYVVIANIIFQLVFSLNMHKFSVVLCLRVIPEATGLENFLVRGLFIIKSS